MISLHTIFLPFFLISLIFWVGRGGVYFENNHPKSTYFMYSYSLSMLLLLPHSYSPSICKLFMQIPLVCIHSYADSPSMFTVHSICRFSWHVYTLYADSPSMLTLFMQILLACSNAYFHDMLTLILLLSCIVNKPQRLNLSYSRVPQMGLNLKLLWGVKKLYKILHSLGSNFKVHLGKAVLLPIQLKLKLLVPLNLSAV